MKITVERRICMTNYLSDNFVWFWDMNFDFVWLIDRNLDLVRNFFNHSIRFRNVNWIFDVFLDCVRHLLFDNVSVVSSIKQNLSKAVKRRNKEKNMLGNLRLWHWNFDRIRNFLFNRVRNMFVHCVRHRNLLLNCDRLYMLMMVMDIVVFMMMMIMRRIIT